MSNEQSWTNHLFSLSVCLDVQCARHMDRDANKEWVAVRNEWPKSAMFEDLEVPIAKRASGVLWFLTCSYLPAVKTWHMTRTIKTQISWYRMTSQKDTSEQNSQRTTSLKKNASGCFKNLRHVWDIWDQYANRGCKQEQVTQNCYVRNLEVQIARTATGLLWSSS